MKFYRDLGINRLRETWQDENGDDFTGPVEVGCRRERQGHEPRER